jgi:N-glycosylase/DNA lyase
MSANAKTIVKKSLTDKKTELVNKENKTVFDFVKLANVSDKIENKTASKVYKNVISSEYAKTILGTSKMPSFAEFVAKLPIKESYSNWHGYLTLSKFNVKNETSKKVARQNKAEAKK